MGVDGGERDPRVSGAFQTPAHVAWVHWQLGDEPVSTLSFHLRIHDDPGSDAGLYLSPINARIDGSQFCSR